MAQYNFKDKYTDYSGNDVNNANSVKFYSALAIGGNGSRLTPYRSNNLQGFSGANTVSIISSGVHVGLPAASTTELVGPTQAPYRKHVIGNGIKNTVLSYNWRAHLWGSAGGQGVAVAWAFKDLTIDNMTFIQSTAENYGTYYIDFRNVQILNPIVSTLAATLGVKTTVAHCILKTLSIPSVVFQNNNSFISISTTIGTIAGSLHTFEKCDLIINQASLTNFYNNHYVFDNCNFRIGTEVDYTPLTSATPDDRRVEFLDRCTAAGLTPPNPTTEYGLTSSIPRWLFTQGQIFEGITWKGSDVNLFEVPRLISFGYNESRGKKIPITGKVSTKESFNPYTPHSSTGLDIAEDSLSIDPTIDITQRNNLYMDSNIIWLGGKKKITKLDLPNNFPAEYGVNIDGTPNLLCDAGQEVASGTIEADEMYMVRSSDTNESTITYNGVSYLSSLNTRNNIFKGVAGVTSFTQTSGTSVVYKLDDILAYQSIQVRIVNKIPSDIITSGSLEVGYWYYVEHDTDQSNTTDFVTVAGIDYHVGESFLVTDEDSGEIGSITGTVHLRRCWKQDFTYANETVDAAFWQNEQKPEWCDVLPEDTRCLMKNNHVLSTEMARGADGKYITTGHPDYYNNITASGGILWPNDIYMSGTYMQIRLPITTVNPM